MFLVKFENDWADEFTVYGLAVLTKEQYELTLREAECMTWNFGSNEGYEEENIVEGFSIISEDPTVIETFVKTLHMTNYGGFLSWGQFPDAMDSFWNRIFSEYDTYTNGGEVVVMMADGEEQRFPLSVDGYEVIRKDIGRRFPAFAE